MKLIQVSDLHFVPAGMHLLGLDPRARLEAAIADINRHHGDAELCLFTGDLTDNGQPEAYAALRETLAALQVPYRLTIGNHDDRDNFLRAFPEAPRDEHGFVQSDVSTDAGHVVVLDTNWPGQHAGSFCAKRQAWLKARLQAAAGGPIYSSCTIRPWISAFRPWTGSGWWTSRVSPRPWRARPVSATSSSATCTGR